MALEPQARAWIFHGEDEFGIAEAIQDFIIPLGDPTMASMNTTILDGSSHSLEELGDAIRAMPFLTAYRLVIFNRPLERLRLQEHQKKLVDILVNVPPNARLVLAIDHILTDARERRRNRVHWLEKWALENPGNVNLRAFPVPVGVELSRWIQARAKFHKGQFTLQAANFLAQQVGPELRVLDHEVQKLLAYVNFTRAVEGDDVQGLTPKTAGVGDFALVDALRDRNSRQALYVLHRQLEDEDPIYLFHRVVSQFRTLIQVREVLERGGTEDDVRTSLKMHPFHARVSMEHARRFAMADLEMIYHRLLEIDLAVKTGLMGWDLALDVLVTELTT